jgi:hypothetical protein
MAKYKAGLHKRISAIFGGVSVVRNDNTGQLSVALKEGGSNGTSLKPSVVEQSPSSLSPNQQTAKPSSQEASSKRSVGVKAAAKNSWRILYQNWKQIKGKLFSSSTGVGASRQKKMVVLMSVLIIVFVFVIIRVSRQPSPQAVSAQNLQEANIDISAALSEKKINWQMPEPYPAALRDPMQAGLSAGGQGGDGGLIVKGIVYSEEGSSAVVDNQIIHQGEKISGATVVKINKNDIEFEMDGRKWTQKVQR